MTSDELAARGVAELLPCPFCGRFNVSQGASEEHISVWCFCGARGPTVSFPEVCIDPASKVQECCAAWNRRAPHTLDVSHILALVDRHVTDDDDRMTLRGAILATEAALALHQQLADAKAAQAMVVERAAGIADVYSDAETMGRITGATEIAEAIRALADPTGVEALAALRKEAEAHKDHALRLLPLANRTIAAEADRDRLAAANAALEAQVARLVGAVEPFRLMSGELFARNWNASDVVIALDNPDDPPRLTFCDFLELHAALAEVQADARREGGE